MYNQIAEKTGMSPEDVSSIGGLESQHGKYEQNMAGSSAKGIMQVMPRLAKTLRPESQKTLNDYNTQAELASDIINLNAPTIKQIKLNSELLDNYVMYNLGKGRGKKFLQATDETPIEQVLPENIIRMNPKLYKHKTVGDAKKAIRMNLDQAKSQEFYPKIEDLYTDTEDEKE